MTQTALESLFDGSLTGEREQRIFTPPSIVRGLKRLWLSGVALDPCHGPGSIVDAECVAWPENPHGPTDGLAIDWPRRTYVNPPFDNLPPWLSRFVRSDEVVMLVPARTHREWFTEAIARVDAAIFLRPLTFLGFDASFPAPLMLLYRGDDPTMFALTFDHLGAAHIGPITLPSKQEDLFQCEPGTE